jgi:hypothetical protein
MREESENGGLQERFHEPDLEPQRQKYFYHILRARIQFFGCTWLQGRLGNVVLPYAQGKKETV